MGWTNGSLPLFCHNYANHALLHELTASYQRRHFPEILQAMHLAEEEVQSIRTIACSSISGRQAFPITAQVFPGQAKRTLANYKSGGGYTSNASGARSDGYHSNRSVGSRGRFGRKHRCFGCGDEEHPWIKRRYRVPQLQCPGHLRRSS